MILKKIILIIKQMLKNRKKKTKLKKTENKNN